ncbi:SDR family oxidoreductase [Chitinophaga sp. 212800010-3]|uniref:SDR family NAD(P)-dependent oxidoreductase n=1 Tax=unclassified Chitinophaga TaxID=2619133 RepID=UPI002DEE95FC|nr:SDR family oxidoreductase [Chitinophaga sp. 212800010-3]
MTKATADKNVVILGGSSGIGRATALRFAKEGWQVIIGAPDEYGVQEVLQQLEGSGHAGYHVDVRYEDNIREFCNAVKNQYGSIHTLVNSVGISEGTPVLESDFKQWNNSLEVMLYGTVRSCRELAPLIVNGGRIVHITSIHYERVAEGSSAYGMAKAAITQFTRSLAVELAPRNILANAIAPGFVNTPMSVKADGRNELDTDWFRDNYIKYGHLPLKRSGEPGEIAGVAYFLAGADASYITGSVITVDGGLTITF